MPTKKLRIIHLSDIHYCEKEKNKINNYVLKPLLTKLKNEFTDDMMPLLCITGDLIDKGGNSSENAESAFNACYEDFILPIMKQLRIENENLIICPGNHDIIKSEDSIRAEKSLKQEFISREIINQFQKEQISKEFPEDHRRILPYKQFEKQLYNGIKNTYITSFSTVHIRKLNGLKICLNCINSVWRYYDDDSNLFIGDLQLDNEYLDISSDCDLMISLSHNTPNAVSKLESKYYENKLAERYQIQLFGHTHDCDMYAKSKFDLEQFFVINSRGLLYSNIEQDSEEYCNGFSIIDYDLTSNTITYYPIKYSKVRNQFLADRNITGDTSDFIMRKLKTNKIDFSQLHEISDYIEKSIISRMDELMLSSGTDTIAPQSFEDLFVEPTLSFRADEKKEISINSLISDSNNYAIIGQKESGKTVLLNYFVKNYIDNIHLYKRIPVLLDGKEKNNNLTTAIAHSLGIKPKDIDDFCNKNPIVLLIDDFNYKNQILIKQVFELITKYQNCKLIFSFTNTPSGEIPLEFTNMNFYSTMNLLDLRSFSHKQISQLAEKWFMKKECYNDEKEEQIEKFLVSFELPRTPMSISMFLWILEKQTDYQPVNQSTMLENFIEQLLNKHAKDQELRNQFDYRNKENLLKNIAKKMYVEKNQNYSLKYSGIIDYTAEYLKNREFDFDPKSIIDFFINTGLFLSYTDDGNTWVRFRFNCFFQFFLMKNMEETEFFDAVLSEEKYLAFSEEINLFTGLKRNCVDILDIIVKRMDEMFLKIQTEISKEHLIYDSFFEVPISISEQINPTKIKALKDSNEEIKESFEQMQDNLLESSEIGNDIEKKDFDYNLYDKLALSISLGLKVLRNTEEVDKENYKLEIFSKILKNVLAFSCINKVLFIKSIQDEYKEMDDDKKKDIESILAFMPLIISHLLEDSLASSKLCRVFEKHLEQIMNDSQVSQIEKFLTVFVYADSKGKNSKRIISDFIKQIKYLYIKDSTFFKLFFYHVKAKNEKERDLYIDSIINLYEKMKKPDRGYRLNKSTMKKELQNGNFLFELAEEIRNQD